MVNIDLSIIESIIQQYTPESEQVLKTAIVNLVESEIQNASLFNKIKNIIKKGILLMKNFKFNLQNHAEVETSEVPVVATPAVSTIVDTAADAIKDTATATVTAAVATAINSTLTTSTSVISDLILKANKQITALQAEEDGQSKSWYVKDIRDPFEVIVIKALVVAVTAGSATALADLTKKLK